jgi:hypothetical protein
MLGLIVLYVFMLCQTIMLSFKMLHGFMLSDALTECHNAECLYAECRGTCNS